MTEILLLIGGFFMGVMNAIAGGGILLGFPVLLGAGLSPLVANATANIVGLPASLSSAYGYRAYIRKVPRMYLLLLVPCFLGAIVGSLLLLHTPTTEFLRLVPWLVAFAVILFTVQPYLHFHLHKTIKKKQHHLIPILSLSLAIAVLSIYGSYFGAGFGLIMLAFLGLTKLHDIHQMNGLKNLAAATISLTTIIIIFPSGLINWQTGLIMAVGSTIGGYYGSKIAQRVSSHALRVAVICIGFVTATYLFIHTI
ncbi:MAG: sulfite exporter TauE/SafE family protein [Candidatus Saccharimonadales bacterium]